MRNIKIKLLQIQISNVDYLDVLKSIEKTFNEKKQIILTGANVNVINLALKNLRFTDELSNFNIVHPDGIGVFLASRFLYGKNGFKKRITGSDFYVEIIKEALKNNWSFFFFGDTEDTLSRISKFYPKLKIVGTCNGFNFNNDDLISQINHSNPDILIVGLGSPKQEEWIIENKDKISSKVIIAVGDGIKVFAGTKKRGTKLVRVLGFEWFVRLINEPRRLWKRYIIGIPLFILRVLKYKLLKQ